jgi:hypothetical protein
MNRSASSFLASLVGRVAIRVYALLGIVLARPVFWFCVLVPLSITVYGRDNTLVTGKPPIIPITAVFALLAVLKGGVRRVVSTWRAGPAVFGLYVLVCAVEVFLMFYHRNPGGWAYVGGRVAFFAVLLTTVAHCDDATAVKDALKGLACGVGVIGLLTLIHALRIVDLPFALPVWPGRTFGPIRMPLPRTLGLAMSPNRFGILAAVALATVMAGGGGNEPIVGPSWVRALLFCVVMAAAVISQTRGVYLTVLLTLGLGGILLLARNRAPHWLAGTKQAWLTVSSYAVLLTVANVVFPVVAPEWIIDVGIEWDRANVSLRADANAVGWFLFKQAPLFGIGHGMLTELTPVDEGIHNHFWEQLVSTGILGGLPYLLFHMLILVSALRLLGSSRSSSRAVAAALVISVSATYLAYQFFTGFFTPVFAVICGLVLSVQRQEQRRCCRQNMRCGRTARRWSAWAATDSDRPTTIGMGTFL